MSPFFRGLFRRRKRSVESQLDVLIAPEIKDDALYRAIFRVASDTRVRQILEIGASSGEGSTAAFVEGASMQAIPPDIHCLEVSIARFQVLEKRYTDHGFVHCYHCSSVPVDRFPSAQEVEAFYHDFDSKLRLTPLSDVLRWLDQDIQYLRDHLTITPGIEKIRESLGIENFDAVLIDGSEFTGRDELNQIYGAGHILLDDTETFKNWENCRLLMKDPFYRLREYDPHLRNGYAVFERADW